LPTRRRRCTKEELEARLAEVEAVLRSGAWSMQAARQLAKRYGVTSKHVEEYRRKVLARWRADVTDQDREAHRARLLEEIRETRRRALANGDAGSLAVTSRLLDLEARLLGLHEPVRVDVAVAVQRDPRELAREVLAAVPEACKVLGLPPPELPDPDRDVIDVEAEEVPSGSGE